LKFKEYQKIIDDIRTTSEYATQKLKVLKKLEDSGKISIDISNIHPTDLKMIKENKSIG